MAQGQIAGAGLVSVKAQWCNPKSFGTADAQDVCFGDDMMGYVIKKDVAATPKGPHCEWLSASLAVICGIPCPNFAVIDHTDGNQWFGSQWRPGQVEDWWIKAKAGQIPITDLAGQLSRLYAFDLFVANVDRHLKNYLVIQEAGGHVVYAMDFGRSWRFSGFPPALLTTVTSANTGIATKYLRGKFKGYFNIPEAELVLDRIDKINVKSVEDIIDRHPVSWLTPQEKIDTLTWWTPANVMARTGAIRKGLHDGSIF
jgi:hypothetical protein